MSLHRRTQEQKFRIYTEYKKFTEKHPEKLKINVAKRFGLSIWSLNAIIRIYEPLNGVGRPPGKGNQTIFPWEV